MPNQIMDGGGRQAFCQAGINWNSDTIKAVLVDSTYTFNSAHANLSDVTSGARIATVTLAGNSSTNGILNCTSPITWTSVTNANQLPGFYIYKDTGTASTSTLICWIDGLIRVTIAAGATSATVTVDPLAAAIANSATLTRVSGTGPSTITLSGSGGGAVNARTLTASTSITTVTGDVYTAPTSGSNFPIVSGLSGATINYNVDSGTNKLFKI
jgi:hypothetical protein